MFLHWLPYASKIRITYANIRAQSMLRILPSFVAIGRALLLLGLLVVTSNLLAQKKTPKQATPVTTPTAPAANAVTTPSLSSSTSDYFKAVRWRNIGPYRGGRSVTACGVVDNTLTYYMGTTGGGLWKTEDAGTSWYNISDGFFKTGSVGAVAVAEADPNVVYVGMGEHAPRGVMTSYGDGVYKSTDAGKTWQSMGLEMTRHIARIQIHPKNADVLWVAAQGALHGPSEERGVYKSTDGGKTWRRTLYVDNNTGCADLEMDFNNPRIMYATMWDHRRLPWEVRSGGPGSSFWKSTDGGETWTKLGKGLPDKLGKMSVSVPRCNSNKVYLLVESDTEKELGGLFISTDAGQSFSRVSKDHRLTQRAWYYIEVFADPNNENTVYVLNSPGLKSIDGGRTWTNIRGTHGDYHQLWINPKNSQNMVIANDGGAAVTFNGGQIWSPQNNQPTAQFYRVNADNLFPYNIYGGQQDNSSVRIAHRNPSGYAITEKDWANSAGGESAFLAFDPNNPKLVMGGSYQGTIELLDTESGEGKPVMVAPIQYQALKPMDMKYRFNWNAPILHSRHEIGTFYHGGNVLFKTTDYGRTWTALSGDLTRNDKSKQGMSGVPYTNEGAGGENYGTLAYAIESPFEKGVFYTGSDDGLVHLTKDGGQTWTNVTPAGLPECLVNCIEVSPHDRATVYIACTRYKENDFSPMLYKSSDYGKTWKPIHAGIPNGAYTRCLREDDVRKGLLYVGTETGLYVSFNDGNNWTQLQMGLPITPITDLKVHQGDLLAATMGRSFWVLDDLTVLRNYDTDNNAFNFKLYPVEKVIRTSGGGGLGNGSETPTRRGGFVGTNAVNGAVLYYQLPKSVDKDTTLTLEIKDSNGQLVRRYSSKEDNDFVEFPGGPDSEPILPAKAGLNRFVWNLRHSTLPGVPRVFIEGNYDGRRVAPGTYTATFSLGTQTLSTTIEVAPHPKIKATPAEYAEQQQWQKKVDDECAEIHQSVLRMRKVRNQVESLIGLLGDGTERTALKKQGQALKEKMVKWEEELVQNKAQSNDDIINYVNKLSADYIFLHGEMDANIPFVTEGQKQQYTALNTRWLPLRQQMQDILRNEVTAFNAACQRADVQAIMEPKPKK